MWFAENGASKIGRITTSGIVSEFPIGALTPFWIVTGSDGNLWFTTTFKQITLGKLTVSGAETSYGGPVSSDLCGLAAGSDGAQWGSYRGGATALRVDTAENITNPAPGALGLLCGDIASGPDGALWITAPDGSGRGGAILRLATSGAVTSFPVDRSTTPYGITAGQDGALWFTDLQGSIGRITTAGQVTKFALPKGTLPATRIATAPDGALWFTGYCVQGNVCQNQGNFTPPNYYGPRFQPLRGSEGLVGWPIEQHNQMDAASRRSDRPCRSG